MELEEGRGSAAMAARYWMTFFVFSVLPAPDSPLRRQRRTESACGGGARWVGSARYEHRLALVAMSKHILPCVLSDCENMRRVLVPASVLVACEEGVSW